MIPKTLLDLTLPSPVTIMTRPDPSPTSIKTIFVPSTIPHSFHNTSDFPFVFLIVICLRNTPEAENHQARIFSEV